MALSLYKPEWQTATPVVFTSKNPLVKDGVTLDVYEIDVEERDKAGNVVGKHTEQCVTHESLLRYYLENLMPAGVNVATSVQGNPTSQLVVIKCSLEKKLTQAELRALVEAGFEVDAKTVWHLESIADASGDNCKTEISVTHLSSTAENRAFDRLLVRYLNLDLGGGRTIYTSSDEIGTPVREKESSEKQDKDWFQSGAQKAPSADPVHPAPAAAPAAAPATAPVTSKVSAPATSPAVKTTPANMKASGEKPVASKPQTVKKQDTTAPKPKLEESEAKASDLSANDNEIAKLAHQSYTDAEFDWMLESKFQYSKSSFNGRTYRELINIVREDGPESMEVCIALFSLIKYKPRYQEQVPVWQRLISYMAKEKLLIVYPSGNIFVGKKK